MIGLILLFATVASDPLANLSTDARYDLSCVEGSSWALSWMQKGSDEFNNVQLVNWYYLGRLSGRDQTTNWIEMYRLDMARNRKSEAYYKESLDSCTSRATDKIMADVAGHAP